MEHVRHCGLFRVVPLVSGTQVPIAGMRCPMSMCSALFQHRMWNALAVPLVLEQLTGVFGACIGVLLLVAQALEVVATGVGERVSVVGHRVLLHEGGFCFSKVSEVAIDGRRRRSGCCGEFAD